MAPMRMTPETFADQFDVSRETMDRLAAFDALLMERSAIHNLIARSTIEDRWARHYADSAQLFSLLPEGAKTVADLGSGAGFPGLVLAAMGEAAGLQVSLVESRGKKASFLREGASVMGLDNVKVIPQRIESTTFSCPDVITARALAQLDKLLQYAHEIADEKTVCLFPKGLDIGLELTAAAKSWHMEVAQIDSLTNPGSTILKISDFAPKSAPSRKNPQLKAQKDTL